MGKSEEGSQLKPYISRVSNDVGLVAPPGCHASVLVTQGEHTIRFDLPVGMPLSGAALESHLAKFLETEQSFSEQSFSDQPPIIIRD